MNRDLSAPRQGQPRIVLLEDEQWLAEMVGTIIRAWDREVDLSIFENGDEALRDLCRQEPDLFITDGCHPGLGGFEILRVLADRNARFPVIWSSSPPGNPIEEDKALCNLRLFLLPKPYPVDQLVNKLNDILGLRDNARFKQDLRFYGDQFLAGLEEESASK